MATIEFLKNAVPQPPNRFSPGIEGSLAMLTHAVMGAVRHIWARGGWGVMLAVILVFWQHAAAESQSIPLTGKHIISEIEVQILDYAGEESYWRQIAHDVISLYIKAGDDFSDEAINASLSALKQCGKFRIINADSRENRQGIILSYRLTPFKRIKEIKIKGKYPLFESKVLNSMTVYPGDSYVQDAVDVQPELIANLFRKHGYIDPNVSIGAWEDPKDRHYILFVNIAKGPYYTLGNIAFEGNATFDESVLKWRMQSWRKAIFGKRTGRFKDEIFKKDIDNIREFYRKRNFFDARITHKLTRNSETGRVDAEITVQEGSLYNITFKGNHQFWDRTLRKQFVFVQTGNRGNLGLRKSIKNIKALYRQAGYPESLVEYEKVQVTEMDAPRRDICLVIDEGPRFIVNRLDVEGNSAYRDGKLKRYCPNLLPWPVI